MRRTFYYIPGRNRQLSLAELKSVISNDLNNDRYIIDGTAKDFFQITFTDISDDYPVQLFQKLGGFIKCGELLDSEVVLSTILPEKRKFKFGISAYSYFGNEKDLNSQLKKLQKSIKDYASNNGQISRYVGSGKIRLSSGQVIGNKLLEEGIELLLFKDKVGNYSIAKTLAVQDIDMYTDIDINKPCTDIDMGVLPVKLARMMINLTGVGEGGVIWDPFCGSGTVILQGLLRGYNMIGSDISEEAIRCSRSNIEWLAEKYDLGLTQFNLLNLDITKVEKKKVLELKRTEIAALVFEPYMGPPMKRKVHPTYAQKHIEHASNLFRSSVEIAENISGSRIRIVGIMPSYLTTRGWITVRNSSLFNKKWKIESFENTDEDLHWDRSNSIIRRNLIIATMFK